MAEDRGAEQDLTIDEEQSEEVAGGVEIRRERIEEAALIEDSAKGEAELHRRSF